MNGESGAALATPSTRSLRDTIRDVLAAEMRNDARVVVLGEEAATAGGVFGVTAGFSEEFGAERVFEMPMSEGGVIGTAIGMALYGLRPVAEIQFADFVFSGFDQLVSEAAKFRYRSAGQYACPLVLRVPSGAGVRGGPYQSQSPEAYLCHTPGLTVLAPSNPADAAGLLRAAIRCEDPVVILEPKREYSSLGEVPAGDDETPIGVARVVRAGVDVTLVAYGGCMRPSLEAAERASGQGIQVEVVDLRTLRPLDAPTILASIVRTGRAVVVSEAPGFCGYGAEVGATLAEQAILHLEAPVVRVSGPETPVPYAFDDEYLPDAARIVAAIERVANF